MRGVKLTAACRCYYLSFRKWNHILTITQTIQTDRDDTLQYWTYLALSSDVLRTATRANTSAYTRHLMWGIDFCHVWGPAGDRLPTADSIIRPTTALLSQSHRLRMKTWDVETSRNRSGLLPAQVVYWRFSPINSFKPKIRLNNYKNSVPTSKKTHCTSLTKPIRLIVFRKINADIWESCDTRKYKVWENEEHLNVTGGAT